jgi:signal transduction histidine kinase
MRPTLSIHGYVTILVIAVVLPFLGFAALLVDHTASGEQELRASMVREAAIGTASDLNRQVGVLQALVLALADSRALQTGDLEAFHDQASELLRRQVVTAVLHDPAGQELVNTAVPLGTQLPADPDAVRRVVVSGRVEVSDLIIDKLTGQPTIDVAAPVMHDGALAYVLSLRITHAVASVLLEQQIPPAQSIGLIDRTGTIIFRTRDSQDIVGLKASAEFLRGIEAGDDGAFLTHSQAGLPLYVAFSRVRLAGWVLAVSIPRDVLFAPSHDSLIWVLALGGGTLVLAMLFAMAIGRMIARPVASLSRLAAALGRGEPISTPPATHLSEVDAVAATMVAATAQLRELTAQRERDAKVLREELASRQRVEQQLIQAQKMEAVGQLTGGLAHDFNNLLAIIIGNLDAVRESCTYDREMAELTGSAVEAALRGAELTRQLLAFARRQSLAPERCDINATIGSTVRLLSRTLGEDIVFDLQLGTGVWPVMVDVAQLEAAIANLATNARDAMPDGGQLTIVTRNTRLDEDYAQRYDEVAPGDYVLIEVTDSGSGMAPEVLQHIFEPFFTTKEPGRGTGLGLSMVFGFMKQSGGHISAYSEFGEGTTFRLYLPPVPDAVASTEPTTQATPELGRNEVILAVEDSAGLREILVRQLTSAGYRVLEAGDARVALETIDSGADIDLLLTDIVMPGGMNGHELARLAMLRRPDLKTLLTTGFSDVTNGNGTSVPLHILRKPYRKDELLHYVREALDGCRSAA